MYLSYLLAIYKFNEHKPFLHFRHHKQCLHLQYTKIRRNRHIILVVFHDSSWQRCPCANSWKNQSNRGRLSGGVCPKRGHCPVGPVWGVCPVEHLPGVCSDTALAAASTVLRPLTAFAIRNNEGIANMYSVQWRKVFFSQFRHTPALPSCHY